MNKTIKIILGVVILVIVVVLLIVFYKPTPKEAIKIGILTPLTGSLSEYGSGIKNGIDLAVNQINSEGGINGEIIQLFYENTQCDPKEAVNGFNKIVDINKVNVILGTLCSSETLAIAPLANQKKVLVISTCATSPEITEAGDYIFRVYPSDDYEGRVAAETIIKKLGKTKISVLYLNNDYGVALKNTFKDKLLKLGGTVISEESYSQDTRDFRTQLTKIKSNEPEIVYFISYPIDGGIAVRQAKELGINAQFIGTSGLKANDFIKTGGSATERFILAAASETHSIKNEVFSSQYKDVFNSSPPLCADRAYDSVYLLQEASRDTDSINDIKDNLYKISGFEGASGEIAFDQNGDLMNAHYDLWEIKNGEFVPYAE